MICPHCGKETTVPKNTHKNKETYALFLEKWNKQKIIRHKKVTTVMKKAIDKVIKNDDYTLAEVFKAFENYSTIIEGEEFFWSWKWTMVDFLNRGLHKFVDEAQPFWNHKKEIPLKPASNNPYVNFSCGGD